jgi:hypothetical protein
MGCHPSRARYGGARSAVSGGSLPGTVSSLPHANSSPSEPTVPRAGRRKTTYAGGDAGHRIRFLPSSSLQKTALAIAAVAVGFAITSPPTHVINGPV